MKKIIAIASMAALVAGAAFAVDFSGNVEWNGRVADYNGTDFTAITLNKNSNDSTLSFYVNGEKAGASFNVDVDSTDYNYEAKIDDIELWVKPVDALKVNLGDVGHNLNTMQFEWWRTVYNITGKGVSLDFSATKDVTVGLGFTPGLDTPWFTTATNSIAGIYGYADIGLGDAGKVSVLFNYGDIAQYQMDYSMLGSKIGFGVGYSGSTSAVSYMVDVAGTFKEEGTELKFNYVLAEAKVGYTAGDLGLNVYVPVRFDVTATEDALCLGTILNVTYKVGDVTPYFLFTTGANEYKFVGGDEIHGWLGGENLSVHFKPGVSGNIGEASYDIGLDFGLNGVGSSSVFKFAVPVTIGVNL